ncbi:hypothetical protein D3C85_1750660 [compost metagenome]
MANQQMLPLQRAQQHREVLLRGAIGFEFFYQNIQNPAARQRPRRWQSTLAITNNLVEVVKLMSTKPLQKVVFHASTRQRATERTGR